MIQAELKRLADGLQGKSMSDNNKAFFKKGITDNNGKFLWDSGIVPNADIWKVEKIGFACKGEAYIQIACENKPFRLIHVNGKTEELEIDKEFVGNGSKKISIEIDSY